MRVLLSVLLTLGATSAVAEPISLALPIACMPGETCFVQHLVDHDDGPGVRDYACGTLTYDKHNGTDFRLPTMAAQRGGVEVRAAAPGRVLSVRDGVADVSIRDAGRAAIAGRECGNGVVLAHANDFQSQYCHLAQGSLAVRPSDEVPAGAVLGRVGLSGDTEFPHLHFTVREKGRVVDPFAYGEAAGTCGGGRTLWGPDVAAALAYKPGTVLNAGFSAGPVTMQTVEEGTLPKLNSSSPALVAFVRTIGLRQGDREHLRLLTQDGTVLAQVANQPLERNRAQSLTFVGKRTSPAPGKYDAEYRLERAGADVLRHRFTITIR